MSQMPKKNRSLYVIWGVAVCIIAGVLASVLLWRSFFSSMPVDQLVREFEQKTGLSVTFHEARYDIWQGLLTLDNVIVTAEEGVRIQSDAVTVNLPVMRYLLRRSLQAEQWRFNQGSVYYRQQSLSFRRFFVEMGQESGIGFIFHGQENDGAQWQFMGQWQVNPKVLKGSLTIENQPFDRFFPFFRALSGFDRKNTVHAQAKVSGKFSVGGQPEGGFTLTGGATLSEGSLVLPDGEIEWQKVMLSDLAFNSQNALWQADSINVVDAVVKSLHPERLLLSPTTLPVAFDSLSMKSGTIFSSGFGESKASFSLNVSADKEQIRYTIKHTGRQVDEGKKLSMTGTVNRHNPQKVPFLAQFSGISLSAKDEVPVLAGADVSGSVISGKVQGVFFIAGNIKADGNVQFDKLMYTLNDAYKGKPWLNRLMSDGKSSLQAAFSVSIEPGEFRKAVLLSVNQQWQSVVDKPFEYLSTLKGINANLTPEVHFQKGTEKMAYESKKNLELLAKALIMRPALKVKVNGYAGRSADGFALAKKEIEADLLSVYRAIHGNEVTTVPAAERAVLLEQMYLRLQGKKLPDIIGAQGSNERAADAEQWLIENWPGNYEATLSDLAVKRGMQIQSLLLQNGVSQDRISLNNKNRMAVKQSFIELE